jgi:acyl-CoA synthetase (AMP-forming)/AMP-acid ligase II
MTHAGMLWYVQYNQRYWPTKPDDRGLIALPLFHKNAMRGTVKPMLYAGGSFVLMPGYEPKGYLEALARYKCSYSRGVAAVFTMFLQHRDELAKLDLSGLRSLTIGSAVVTHELMDEVERAIPGVRVGEATGSPRAAARSASRSTAGPCRAARRACRRPNTRCAWSARTARTGTTRRALAQVALQLPRLSQAARRDARQARRRMAAHGRRLPARRAGLLLLQEPGRTTCSPAAARTSTPKEVEDLLFRHPAVANAVVAPVPHAVKGYVPAALVVLKRGASASAEEIKAYCLDEGPKYAHPRFVEIIGERDMPLNGAGKIDRNLARAKARYSRESRRL